MAKDLDMFASAPWLQNWNFTYGAYGYAMEI